MNARAPAGAAVPGLDSPLPGPEEARPGRWSHLQREGSLCQLGVVPQGKVGDMLGLGLPASQVESADRREGDDGNKMLVIGPFWKCNATYGALL